MALCAEGDLPRPALNRYRFSRVVPQSGCGDGSFLRFRWRPCVFGLAGFKPALTENHRSFECGGWRSRPPMLPIAALLRP